MTYPYVSSDNPHESSVALRPKARDCDECGLNVIGRVIFIEKKSIGNKNEYWRTRCGECNKKTRLHNGLKDV
jgi:ssDNA-binding Zn-finger/Zn-ribbon topoisomerase 1